MKNLKPFLRFINPILLLLSYTALVMNGWVIFYFLNNHKQVIQKLALTNDVWLYYASLGVGVPLLFILLTFVVSAIFYKGKTWPILLAEKKLERAKR